MSAWIRGRAVAFEAAVEEAAETLGSARSPVIAGLAADVDAIRAAFALGARIGASFDPVGGSRLYAQLAALAERGALETTPSEMLARADLVLAVGPTAAQSPIVALAQSTKAKVGRGAGRRSVRVLDAGGSNEPLAVTLGLVRALATGRLARNERLSALAAELPAALYGVAVYDPLEAGELGVEMLQGLAAELSERTRFFTLPLSDPWQGGSAVQVSAWTAGGGPRVGFARGFPEHDPWRFDAARQAAAGEIDAVLWLSPLPAPRPPWTAAQPSVAILGDVGASAADVVFAVGVPGRTCDGVLWDERRATLAFRSAPSSDGRPNAASVVRAIEQTVVRKRSA
jgi:formylmethanofuran dehydrogenase subunit B